MNDEYANTIRLHANEIMRLLYVGGQRDQLDLLRLYADSAIKELDAKSPPPASQSNPREHKPSAEQ